jgi:uncharacterized phage protein (TIGR01671 family)
MKFRAWDSKNKKFPFDEFHIIGECTVFDLINQYRIEEFNDLVVEQYTGVKDKNGKEICEGDIVKYCSFINNDKEEWKTGNGVVFERGCFWVGDRKASGGMLDQSDYKSGDPALMYWQDSRWLEIIGNIHENPDLLS